MGLASRDVVEANEQPFWYGAVAGTLATFPMTVFMLATQRLLPRRERYDLPPELIVKDLAHKVHIKPFLSKQQILVATVFSHFGYGAAMGVLYRLFLPRPLLRGKRSLLLPAQGLLFGLLVWVASYLGLLPLLKISASGHREPGRRNLLMIGAHEVWGLALGISMALLPRQKEQ